MTLLAVFLIPTLSQFSNCDFQVCGITQTFKLCFKWRLLFLLQLGPGAGKGSLWWVSHFPLYASIWLTEDSDPGLGEEGRRESRDRKGAGSSYLVNIVVSWHLTGYAWWVFKPDSLSLGTIVRILQWIPSFLIFGDFWTASPLKVVA